MTVIHVQAILPRLGGMTRDAAVNTFTFSGTLGVGDSVNYSKDKLLAFYNSADTAADPIAAHLNRTRSRLTDACTFRFYDITAHLNGTDAGPPVAVVPWTLGTNVGTDALPEEVALALSFHGDDDSIPEFGPGTRPRSRHRGRVYIGPLLYDVSAGAPGDPLEPSSGLIDSLVGAGTDLAAASDAGNTWVVWSRRNAAVYPVIGGWVDNAFDTIRKRGFDPTVRTTWPPPV